MSSQNGIIMVIQIYVLKMFGNLKKFYIFFKRKKFHMSKIIEFPSNIMTLKK